jgi:hypothetical protein
VRSVDAMIVVAIVLVLMAIALPLAWRGFLGDWLAGPCHQGHYSVVYSAPYTSTTWHEVGDISYPTYQHHPATCDQRWGCDLRCRALDKATGALESHAAHETIQKGLVIDERCEFEPGGWSPRG